MAEDRPDGILILAEDKPDGIRGVVEDKTDGIQIGIKSGCMYACKMFIY